MESIKQKIKTYAHSLGLIACGIAPFPLPQEVLPLVHQDPPCPFTSGSGEERLYGGIGPREMQSAIVVLFPYYKNYNETSPTDCPNLSRYTWGEDYHLVTQKYMEKLAAYVKQLAPHAKFEIHADTSPLADRQIAYRAGLGFFGENHCLIHPTLGSFTFIASLLTSLPLPPDMPLSQSCLGCRRCISSCPGQVLGHERFYFERCKSYLTQKKGELTQEEKEIIQKSHLIFGCDICQEVCPHNQNIPPTPLPEFQSIQPHLSIKEIETKTNREFKSAYGHRAFSWRGKAILIRNHNIIQESKKTSSSS